MNLVESIDEHYSLEHKGYPSDVLHLILCSRNNFINLLIYKTLLIYLL